MDFIKNIGLIGAILFGLTVMIPLVIISTKGFRKDSYHHEKTNPSIFKVALFIFLAFFILPSGLFFLFSFVKFVLMDKMPLESFQKSLWEFSGQPVLNFYSDVIYNLRSFIYNAFNGA